MTEITHHVSTPMLAAYAAGTLGTPFQLVVASHVSLCDECRAALGAHEAAGGAILATGPTGDVSTDLKARVLTRLDDEPDEDAEYPRFGIYPGPVMTALKGKKPHWRSLGMGVRQCILDEGKEGSTRLLYIPPETAVPDHGHNGTELTLVLQGSFSDETGAFGVGDLEYADSDLEHIPVAGSGPPCICLAATDAPLRFKGLIPRLIQPLLRI